MSGGKGRVWGCEGDEWKGGDAVRGVGEGMRGMS